MPHNDNNLLIAKQTQQVTDAYADLQKAYDRLSHSLEGLRFLCDNRVVST